LVHHLWPSIPWYNYQPAYFATKPLLDAKGSHQSLGILQTPKDFFGFLYDVVVGIRFHKPQPTVVKAARENAVDTQAVDPKDARSDDLAEVVAAKTVLAGSATIASK